MIPFVCVIPGDGCGVEVIRETVKILDILSDKGDLNYDIYDAGAHHYRNHGKVWEKGTFEQARESDAILFGAVGMPDVRKPDGTFPASEVIFGLRNRLDLYANIRPIKLYEGIKHGISGEWRQVWKPENVDLVIVRELTEGLYVRIGGEVREGELAIDNRIITEVGSRRVVEFAANLALQRNRKHITCVDKSNVLKGDILFREVFSQVLQHPEYGTLTSDGYYVDAFSMFLMTSPEKFDVIVTPNIFGDILSDLGSIMAGGIGMAPSGSFGFNNARFEPIHGSAPDIAGKGIVNPSASLLSLSMLLKHLGEGMGRSDGAEMELFSASLEEAVVQTIQSGNCTRDLGGTATTSDFGDAVRKMFIQKLKIGC